MSFIGDMFNSSKGAGYQAGNANVVQPSTLAQANHAYEDVNNVLNQQQGFVNALTAQNGIGNQSSVFNQSQQLANQLQTQAQGGGPNPAAAQLANTTGQNVANQAALMAGQRGSGANAGLIARQAGQQGMQAQQQAAGQAAVLRANQQLAAQGALQNQQGLMGNIAGQQIAQQGNALSTLSQARQSEQQQILGGIQGQNQSNVGIQSNMNSANAGIAQGNQKAQQDLTGGLLKGASAFLAEGGTVPSKVTPPQRANPYPSPAPIFDQGVQSGQASMRKAFHYADGGEIGPKSFAAKFLSGTAGDTARQNVQPEEHTTVGGSPYANPALGEGSEAMSQALGKGIKGMFSSGGSSMAGMGASDIASSVPTGMMLAAQGGKVPMDYTSGGKLPGKAAVKGDSLKNDKVPIMGSPGEIMLPRSVTQHPNAPEKAREFVAAIMAKKHMGLKK